MSQYDGDDTPILASPGTAFAQALNCTVTSSPEDCSGTAELWVTSSFTDWSVDNVPYNLAYFAGVIIGTRIITFWALTSLDYRAN